MDILKLIDCMRARAPLWNRKSPLYTARVMKKQLWNEVMELTGATEDEVRRKWKCLNDIFRREHNKYVQRKRQDSNAEPPQWKYYYHMLFLESHIGTRYAPQPKSRATDAASAAACEDREDNSMDSMVFEELTNFAEVTIKSEMLEASSLECGGADDLLEELPAIESCGLENRVKAEAAMRRTSAEANAAEAQDVAAEELSPVKRLKPNQEQHEDALENKYADDVVVPPTGQNSGNTVAPACCCYPAAGHLFAQRPCVSEQRRMEEFRDMLMHVQQHQQTQAHRQQVDDDDDYHFALSLVPTMRGLPTQRKMLLRMKIQKLLCDEFD